VHSQLKRASLAIVLIWPFLMVASLPLWSAPPFVSIGTGLFNAAPGCYTVTGGIACRSPGQVATDVFNARDFGAVGDGLVHHLYQINSIYLNGAYVNTSAYTLANWQAIYPAATATGNNIDGLAISATIQAAALVSSENGTTPVKVVLPNGDYQPNTSINSENLRGNGATISAYGAVIHCLTTGQICFDAIGTEQTTIEGLTLVGDATSTPSFGFVDGRAQNATGSQADGNVRRDLRVVGSFTTCGVLSSQDEESLWEKLYAANAQPGVAGAGPYAACIDGINHFAYNSGAGQISQFNTWTLPAQDTGGSFNHFTCHVCNFSVTGGGAPLWFAYLQGAKFGGYAFQNSTTNPYAMVWYNINGSDSRSLDFTALHAENTSINYRFLVTGPQIANSCTPFTANVLGITDNDHGDHSQLDAFKIDPLSCVTFMNATDVHLHYGAFAAGSANPGLVADPALWCMTGDVELPSLADWINGAPMCNQVNLSQNTVYNPTFSVPGAYSTTEMFPYNALQTEVRNGKFDLDRQLAHTQGAALSTGSIITDGWSTLGLLSINDATWISTATSPPSDATYSLQGQAAAAYTTVIASSYTLAHQTIEGPWIGPLQYGQQNALPFTVDFYAKTNVTGGATGTVAFTNAAGTRSYAQPYTITTVNQWQRFSFQIPGDVNISTTNWLTKKNTVGMIMSFPLSAGANYQIAAKTWTTTSGATPGYSVSGATNFLATLGNTLNIADVAIFQTPNDQALLTRPIDQETARADHYYQDSFPEGIVPSSNVCTVSPAACTGTSPHYNAIGASTTYVPTGAIVGNILPIPIRFPVEFFSNSNTTLPTVTPLNPSTANALCRDVTAGIDMGAAVVQGLSAKSMTLGCTLVTGFAANDEIQVEYVASVAP
jgi:hypothetical protein